MLTEKLLDKFFSYAIIPYMSKTDSRGGNSDVFREESPGFTEQGCRLTTGGGNSKESATENYRRMITVRVKRRGKSSPAIWQLIGRVNPT